MLCIIVVITGNNASRDKWEHVFNIKYIYIEKTKTEINYDDFVLYI